MKTILTAGAVFVVAAVVVLLCRSDTTAPAPVNQAARAPAGASIAAADIVPAAETGPGVDRTPLSSDAVPAAPGPALPAWLGEVEVLTGHLSPSELATALSYVGPLIEHAANEVQQGKFDGHSAEDLAAESAALQRLELWRTVEKKLMQGDYFVMTGAPQQVRPPKGKRFEALPSWKDGRAVTLGFVFERETTPNLFDAALYAKDLESFRLQEAARSFNSRSDDERRRLLAEYRQLRREHSWNELPIELQRVFPIENVVDDATLWMRVPPGR